MIGELAVRAPRLPLALKCADERERMLGAARGPGPAAVARAAEPERDLLTPISEARKVGGAAVRTERHIRIAAKIVDAGAWYGRIVRKGRNSGDEPARQGGRPSLPAVEGRVHAAAVVVIPVVGADDHVQGVFGIDGDRGLVLGCGVAADVHDLRRAGAAGAEAGGAEGGDGGFAAGDEQQTCAEGGVESGSHAGSPSNAETLHAIRRLNRRPILVPCNGARVKPHAR